MTASLLSDPEHIAISKSRGIEIDWKDGHHSSFGIDYLRDWCPCATCTGAHGTKPRPKQAEAANPFQMYKEKNRMVAIEPAGNYALKFEWNDGHSSGIYSYEYLRRVCPCPPCTAARDAA